MVSHELARQLGNKVISDRIITDRRFNHPVTGVNYIKLYQEIISGAGARPVLFLDNDPLTIVRHSPQGVIVSNVHQREQTKRNLKQQINNCITLEEVFNCGEVSSEWGLLGGNKSSGNKIRWLPNDRRLVEELQQRVARGLGVNIEVLIYGDGATMILLPVFMSLTIPSGVYRYRRVKPFSGGLSINIWRINITPRKSAAMRPSWRKQTS